MDDLISEARTELTDARRVLESSGGGHPNAYARAAQIAVVAQAEAAHRQADALERLATAAEKIEQHLDFTIVHLGTTGGYGAFRVQERPVGE